MRRIRSLAPAVILCAALTSCARAPQIGELGSESRRQRFEIELARRSQAAGCEADLLAWPRVTGWRELPGLQARVLIGAPDAVRIRIGSWFGSAIDLSARGDSVTAWIPGQRLAMETAHAGDSLGVAVPGRVGYQILSAGWAPPASAWERAAPLDSLLVLTWEDDQAALRIAIGTSGLPVWVERRAAGDTLRVDYVTWRTWEDVRWPARLEIREMSGAFEVPCRIERVRFHESVGREYLAVPIPTGIERLDGEELRRLIAELGGS